MDASWNVVVVSLKKDDGQNYKEKTRQEKQDPNLNLHATSNQAVLNAMIQSDNTRSFNLVFMLFFTILLRVLQVADV